MSFFPEREAPDVLWCTLGILFSTHVSKVPRAKRVHCRVRTSVVNFTSMVLKIRKVVLLNFGLNAV